MENQIHKFFKRFRPGFGLLRSLRGALPAGIPEDVESGPAELIQSQPQVDATDATETAPQSPNTGSLGAEQENHVDASDVKSASNEDSNERDGIPQPQFTEGPSRFVLAKDGSRDCVALLVNEGFLTKLRDLIHENRDARYLDRPLYHARMVAENFESSVQKARQSLETAESEEQAEVCQNSIEQNTSELLKINRRKEGLEKERNLVHGRLELLRSHTQWVWEMAMTEADLLGPERPLPAVLLRDEETRLDNTEEKPEVPEEALPARSSTVSVASDYEEDEVSEDESQRRAAYADFVDRLQHLNTIQGDFDEQRNNYNENLDNFQQKLEAGTNKMSRSDFDRRSVQYGQELTRALIDAEEAFEEARDRAQALGAIASDYGHEFYYGAEYAESWPENQIAEYNASQDWTFVENWMDDIPDSTSQADSDSVEVDEWDAEEVDVNDSISMMDCEDYGQDIDRYQRMCARLEDPYQEVRWLGQPDARILERRSSCWM